jgi:DNA-binding IscR family transcriptional regulator
MDCKQSPQCAMHRVWEETRTNMLHVFRNTTIASIRAAMLQVT